MKRTLIGMLTPSSNTILEPVTSLMLADAYPDVTAHFARFRVTAISLDAGSQSQFEQGPILAAADLLADAKVHAIAWNGTSASWLGFERDEMLCRTIAERTGIKATSAILGLNDLLARNRVRRLGLVTPYVEEVQKQIATNYRAAGIEVVAERHLGRTDNFSFSEATDEEIESMCRDVSAARPDAIAIVCTNMRGGFVAPKLEEELGVPVLDSVAFTLWKTLEVAGAEPGMLSRFGRFYN